MRRLLASLTLAPLALRVLAQCESKCDPISDLLASCSLPSLSMDWEEVEERGLTDRQYVGTSKAASWSHGPFTHIVENPEDADCLCIEARTYFPDCERCLFSHEFGNQPLNDKSHAVNIYQSDCVNLGYWANETLAYPSTTRSSMPSATLALDEIGLSGDDDDEGGADDNCDNLCGVANGQVVECGLLPLNVPRDDRVPRHTIESPGEAYFGAALLNRTAAECVCTLPVLRRLHGCWECLGRWDRRDLGLVVYDHEFDCNQLGYWSDSEFILPEEEDVSARRGSGPSDGDDETGSAVGDIVDARMVVCALLLFVI